MTSTPITNIADLFDLSAYAGDFIGDYDMPAVTRAYISAIGDLAPDGVLVFANGDVIAELDVADEARHINWKELADSIDVAPIFRAHERPAPTELIMLIESRHDLQIAGELEDDSYRSPFNEGVSDEEMEARTARNEQRIAAYESVFLWNLAIVAQERGADVEATWDAAYAHTHSPAEDSHEQRLLQEIYEATCDWTPVPTVEQLPFEVTTSAQSLATGAWEVIEREPADATLLGGLALQDVELSARDLGCLPGVVHRVALVDAQGGELVAVEIAAT